VRFVGSYCVIVYTFVFRYFSYYVCRMQLSVGVIV